KVRDPRSRFAAVHARAVLAAGMLASFQNDHDVARRLNEEALELFRQQEDLAGIEVALDRLAIAATMRGDHAAAWDLLEQQLALSRARGGSPVASALVNLANVAHQLGDVSACRTFFEEGLAIVRELAPEGPYSLASPLMNVGIMLEEQGDPAAARALYEE